MPASIGLTHLRVRTHPRHTFAERLAALERMDEEEREALARQWRNTTARGPPPASSRPERPQTLLADPATAAAAASSSSTTAHPSLMVVGGKDHRRKPKPTTTTTTNNSRSSSATRTNVTPRPIEFLSPPTTLIRGPMSYTEDPRQRRQQQNEYLQYFQSSLHDDIVARQLSAQSSEKTSRRRDQERRREKSRQDRERGKHSTVDSTAAAVDYDEDLGFSPGATARRRSPTRSQSPSHCSISGPLPHQALQGVDMPPMQLPKFRGGSATPGAAGDSTSRRSLLTGNTLRTSANEPPQRVAQGSSGGDTGELQRRSLPDHVPDPERLRRFRSRYQDGHIDVHSLKPKCAVLHVKLEKINRRMKAEDDEFRTYRDAYLRSLR